MHATLTARLATVDDGAQGIRSVDLHASAQGEPIYRAAGFTENDQPALRWRSA